MNSSFQSTTHHINSLLIASPPLNRFLQVSEAVVMANELLNNVAFYNNIAAHPYFDMADISPKEIAELMMETKIKLSVDLYYASNSELYIDGYDDLYTPSLLHLNLWKVNRSAASICNSLIHGCVHAVNAYNNSYGFGHGEPEDPKENTAPYWIGALAQRMVCKGAPLFLPWSTTAMCHQEAN
jgi:hypothetical protein